MHPKESNNGRIVKNTLFLYFRMILLTIINIYTVRIILDALGVEDYGIFSVISSAVLMLGFVQGTLSSATQRYFSYQIAQNDLSGFRRLFSLVMVCFLIVSGIVLFAGGIAGPWITDEFLNIPSGRDTAAIWVYYSSLGIFILGLLTIPFTASMISHEKMNGFAYISIFDGVGKLIVAFGVMYSSGDHLIFYAILSFIQSLITFLLYAIYCRKNFEGVQFSWYWEKNMFKELMSYTGWNLFGSVSGVLSTSGQGIVLNLFFGPIINTAKGIADRLYSVVQSFATNFYLAVSPQIIKSYATRDLSRMFSLVISSTKFSYFLLLIISYPFIICMPAILRIWLGENNVTLEMIIFSQLALILTLVNSLEQPITQMIRATGNIKNYQIVTGVLTLFYLPIVALFLYLGAAPQSSMLILILQVPFVLTARLIIAKRQLKFPVNRYLIEAILPISIVSLILGLLGFFFYNESSYNLLLNVIKGSVTLVISVICSLFLGMNSLERKKVFSFAKQKILHHS